MPKTKPNKSDRKSTWARGILLVMLTGLVYLPALRAGFIWDDDDYVTKNQLLVDAHGLRRIWTDIGATPQYYPLVYTSFWVERQLWGLDPTGFHATNILLHGLAAVLLWRLLLRLQVPGAWLVAAIFALHPIQVESVAWITERKNVLSAVFYFAAALAFFKWEDGRSKMSEVKERKTRPSDRARGASDWRIYALSLGFFLCALWSKTVTASLPAALLLVAWWKKGRVAWRDAAPTLPFFAIGIAMGLLTASLERRLGAVGPGWAFSFGERCLIAGRALWFYAAKLLWPARLTFIYPRWELNTHLWWQWLFPCSAVLVVIILWILRNRIGRGALTAVLFFAGTLFPALGFLNVYPMRFSFVADHFQYLANVGLIALAVGATCAWVSARIPKSRELPAWVLTLTPAAALLIAAGVLTWERTMIYRDLETLWRDTLRKNPDCWMAHYNLGAVLTNKGESLKAMEQYELALQSKPDFFEAHNDLGALLTVNREFTNAFAHFHEALRIKPDFASTHNNLGIALALSGKPDSAVVEFKEALRLKPDYPEAQFSIATVLVQLGRRDEAIEHLREALRLKPDYEPGRQQLRALTGNSGG